MSKSNYVPTIDDVALAVGVDQRTVKTWLKAGAPGKTESGYDIEAIKEWREINRRSGPGEMIDPTEFQLRMAAAKLMEQEGKAQKVTAEAGIQQFKEQELTEDVCRMLDVHEFLADFFSRHRRGLEKIPKQLAAAYAPNIQDDLETDIRERLEIELRALHSWVLNASELRDE